MMGDDSIDLDAWYELMKRIQQYPEEDGFFLKGTNLIDWSLSAKVALYFMNEDRTGDGALFVCDATATGNTLQTVPLGSILDKMSAIGNSGQALGAPLLFQPGRQIKNQRPKNQEVAYFAQMDLRYDLQEIWKLVERDDERGEIVLKLVLPFETKDEINTYLGASEIDTSFIYPDRGTSAAKQ